MNKNTEKLKAWAIRKIQEQFPEDIDLLIAVKGQSVNNDGHGECFDYFVPATDRGYEMAQTFILEGIGHDLYPRSWNRLEAAAEFDDGPSFCLADSEVVYARNEEVRNHYEEIMEKMRSNLRDKKFMYRKALERLDMAMDFYRTLAFEEHISMCRMGAGFILNYLSGAVAFLNGTYADCYGARMKTFKKLPEKFTDYCEAVIHAETIEEIRYYSWSAIKTTRSFALEQHEAEEKTPVKPYFPNLAEWYQELSLIWRRLAYYCRQNEVQKAFADACYLQSELNIVQSEYGLKKMDLLERFCCEDLSLLEKRAEILENYIIGELERNGIQIASYETINEFLENN